MFDLARFLTPVLTSSLLQKQVYYHPVASPLIQSTMVFFLFLSKIGMSLQNIFPFIKFFPNFLDLNNFLLKNAPLPSEGAMMIYSSGDKLIPKDKIVEFKEKALVTRGCKVEELVFGDDVGHTSAFFLHQRTYIQAIDKFLGLAGPECQGNAEERGEGRGGNK